MIIPFFQNTHILSHIITPTPSFKHLKRRSPLSNTLNNISTKLFSIRGHFQPQFSDFRYHFPINNNVFNIILFRSLFFIFSQFLLNMIQRIEIQIHRITQRRRQKLLQRLNLNKIFLNRVKLGLQSQLKQRILMNPSSLLPNISHNIFNYI